MNLTDVEWVRDHQHRQVLQLRIDGHLAHICSEQQLALTRRGIVKGIDFFASEWRGQVPNRFISFAQRDCERGLVEPDLAGCTDEAQVFALYQEMCRAIAAGSWRPGPRRCQPEVRPAQPADRSALGPRPGNRRPPSCAAQPRPC